jgi:hypothetical protein
MAIRADVSTIIVVARVRRTIDRHGRWTVRFLESARTIHANGEQAIGETRAALAFYAFEPLPDSLGDRGRHAPVSLASSATSRCASALFIFSPTVIPFYPYCTMVSVEASSFVNAAPLLIKDAISVSRRSCSVCQSAGHRKKDPQHVSKRVNYVRGSFVCRFRRRTPGPDRSRQ